MNSVLQILFAIDPLSNFLTHGDYKSQLNTGNKLGIILIEKYVLLMNAPWDKNALRVFTYAFRHIAPVFNNDKPHDSGDGLICLLDIFHDSFNRVKPMTKEGAEQQQLSITADYEEKKNLTIADASIFASNVNAIRDDSVINDMFHGKFFSTKKCGDCDTTLHKVESFSVLALPIPAGKGPHTLADCISLFTREEILDSFTCGRCNQTNSTSTNRTVVYRLPTVLVVQLKREQNTPFAPMANVICPLNVLDTTFAVLKPSSPHVFNAASNRINRIQHYTGIVRHSTTPTVLFKCDDENVSLIQETDVRGEDAYLMVYTSLQDKR